MPFLKKGVPDTSVPDWAGNLSAADLKRFERMVDDYLTEQRFSFELNDGWVTVHGIEGRWGLENLAKSCSNAPDEDWPELIAEHFRILLAPPPDTDEMALDFTTARTLLKLKIWPVEYFGPGLVAFRPLDDLLMAALVYDLPDKIVNVKPEHVSSWNVSSDDVFAIAEENMRQAGHPPGRPFELPGGAQVMAFESESVFTSSHALWLDKLTPVDPDHGALIAIPNRHLLVAYPLTDLSVVKAIAGMVPLAHRLYESGPGSLSRDCYWWRERLFTRLPSGLEENKISFSPPPEFVDVMNKLGPAPGPIS